jgi:tetraacyldisaccharide 4'-kinase
MNLVSIREKLLGNFFGRALLACCAFIYGLLVEFNVFLYKAKWRKSKKVAARVVCIGNIAAGGAGKTTAVMFAAALLSKKGVSVAVASRGYKRPRAYRGVKVLFGQDCADWREAGDEPYMMSRLLAGYNAPVLVSKNRYKAAKEAFERFKSQVILLDDGMQHYKLERDADIVLLNASDPFGGGKLLPYGTLREPLSGLKRASLVIITHSDLASKRELVAIEEQIRKFNRRVDVLRAVHKPEYFFDVNTGEKINPTALKGEAAAFCALGNPETFELTLKNIGADLKRAWRFADHYGYCLEDIKSLSTMRGNLPLITTFKDFVKLPEGWRDFLKDKFYVLAVSMEICGGATDKFLGVLYPALKKKIKERQ